jgi:FKBP-type peptidyl-prolyl cis-trans isomerase
MITILKSTLNNSALKFSLLLSVVFFLTSCDKYPGYEKMASGLYKRLEKFGDCEPRLKHADFFIMQVSYKKAAGLDTGYTFLLHHHNIDKKPLAGDNIGLRLASELALMQCGEQISWILLFSEFDDTYLGAYADTSIYPADQEMRLTLELQKTFTDQQYLDFLMSMAQHQEISETEAIELYLMNTPDQSFEKHGDCFIRFDKKLNGDSIKAGRLVNMQWNTFLFNGEQLDDTTDMQFVFGKPGQLIGGFQYGLSFMGEGDEATIYLPSYLAFGEQGSSSGIVPRNTPVYLRVRVKEVVTEEEFAATLPPNRKKK